MARRELERDRVARAVAAALLACACVRPAEPFDIPAAADIEFVHVTRWGADYERQADYRIAERPRVEAILEQLRHDNTGYTRLDGKQTIEWAIVLEGKDSVPLAIWIGPDWLGGVDLRTRARESRSRRLAPDEKKLLLSLIHQR